MNDYKDLFIRFKEMADKINLNNDKYLDGVNYGIKMCMGVLEEEIIEQTKKELWGESK